MKSPLYLVNKNGCIHIFNTAKKCFVKLTLKNIREAVTNEPFGHRDSLENRDRKTTITAFRIISDGSDLP